MAGVRSHVEGLVRLHELTDPEEQKAVWRQSLASLASAVENQHVPVPLEGLPQEALVASIRAAFDASLLDDLSWLSGPAAAAALYELAVALPTSEEKREIGKRLLKRLTEADAATFVALATRFTLTSRRTLDSDAVRARVVLALEMPTGSNARSDALALALISRADLQREWLTIPSTGSLASRRMAARLLERAARESLARAEEGDDSGIRIFEQQSLRESWDRLFYDRELLVWKHVAVARGLLSEAVTGFGEEINGHLGAQMTPTEWRRAATSLAASITVRKSSALLRCHELLASEIFRRDPGIARAMSYALPRVAEVDPESADSLMLAIVRSGELEALEGIAELRHEMFFEGLFRKAAEQAYACLTRLQEQDSGTDEGRAALIDALLGELTAGEGKRETLPDLLTDAVRSFAEQGAREAHRRAHRVLRGASERLALLEEAEEDLPSGRKRAFQLLRELDTALFETDALSALLRVGARNEEVGKLIRPLSELFVRVATWLVQREQRVIPASPAAIPDAERTLRMRRLRTLLHFVDADGSQIDERNEVRVRRQLRTARMLVRRARDDAPSPLRRALLAALARACDSLVREGLIEISDVVLMVWRILPKVDDILILSEASMVPEIETVLYRYAKLVDRTKAASPSGHGLRPALNALAELAASIPPGSSPRVEALRLTLRQLSQALESLASARSLGELVSVQHTHTPVAVLETATDSLSRLLVGTARRLEEGFKATELSAAMNVHLLGDSLDRYIHSSEGEALDPVLDAIAESIRQEFPTALADLTLLITERLARLPAHDRASMDVRAIEAAPRQAPLPAWMPANRVIGDFYVVRSLGAGATGSVFVARRAQDRYRKNAIDVAMKVPGYDGRAARQLSEEEFLSTFRQEAGVLLTLPSHPNLARFVTFDAEAKPKPILVMELVEGPTLERILKLGELSMGRALDILLGIASGLQAMHALGVGHFDIKPSNIILREGEGSRMGTRDAVLVDFGLAGRHLRPGCGTIEYGAPELWMPAKKEASAAPSTAADVYSFACLIFETLSGKTLFAGPNEVAVISMHVSHDGSPAGIRELIQRNETRELGLLLQQALRRDPAQRISVAVLHGRLHELRTQLMGVNWPLPMPSLSNLPI